VVATHDFTSYDINVKLILFIIIYRVFGYEHTIYYNFKMSEVDGE